MAGNNKKSEGSVGLGIDELGRESEYDALNLPYGVMNNFVTTADPFEHTHEAGKVPNFFIEARGASERRAPHIALSGPYRGVVLRVDSSGAEQASEESDLQRVHAGTNSPTSAKSLQFVIRVRIPELHPHLPIPLTIPKPNTKGDSGSATNRNKIDNDIIDMYPKFVGYVSQAKGTALPQIGAIVIVDFTNRLTQQGGCYIGPLNSDHGLYPTTTELVNSSSKPFGANSEDGEMPSRSPLRVNLEKKSQMMMGKSHSQLSLRENRG